MLLTFHSAKKAGVLSILEVAFQTDRVAGKMITPEEAFISPVVVPIG
jgi:hypothetical protein